MMKESVIVTKLNIKLQGERKHFQIKLPSDIKSIIGIECSVRMIDAWPVPPAELPREIINPDGIVIVIMPEDDSLVAIKSKFKPSQFVGELRIQSYDLLNWFYVSDVFANDVNLNLCDVSDVFFRVKEHSHGIPKHEEIMTIPGITTLVQGWFLDAIGKQYNLNLRYEVSIYVWIKTED